MTELQLHLLDPTGDIILAVEVNPNDALEVMDDEDYAAECALGAIIDAQLDYRVLSVDGHFPAEHGFAHVILVHVEPYA